MTKRTRGVKQRAKMVHKNAMTKHLTENQKRFCEELVASTSFSPKEAAEKAGYKQGAVAGAKILKNPYANAYISDLIRIRSEKTELKAETVLKELMHCCLRDPIGLVDEEGYFHTNLHDIPEELRRAIDGIKVKQTRDEEGNMTQTLEIKFVSKASMIELAMKHLGLLDADGNGEEQLKRLDWDKLLEGEPNNVIEI